jgi:hypothetical protein
VTWFLGGIDDDLLYMLLAVVVVVSLQLSLLIGVTQPAVILLH